MVVGYFRKTRGCLRGCAFYLHALRLQAAASGPVWRGISSDALQLERHSLVLGIESSCDDTAAALVEVGGKVRGEAVRSQLEEHRASGGVIPIVAAELHRRHLQRVTAAALEGGGAKMKDVGAVAVTTGPGLALCLHAGLDFAKEIAIRESKPLLSVHHMEAHALVPRLGSSIPFPYLVLLVSGGHCLLAVAHAPGCFSRLGSTRDDSPGEAFDKVARWLHLPSHPELGQLSGGAAIERLARSGDPSRFPLPHIMPHRRCCDFSFSGLKTSTRRIIARAEISTQWKGEGLIEGSEDIAASFQTAVCRHLLSRTQRAILFCQRRTPPIHDLVVSGGVASNQFICSQLAALADAHSLSLHSPPPPLCTDNGIMVAWAAIEHIRAGTATPSDAAALDFRPRWPLGEDCSEDVKEADIGLPKQAKTG